MVILEDILMITNKIPTTLFKVVYCPEQKERKQTCKSQNQNALYPNSSGFWSPKALKKGKQGNEQVL